MRPTQHPSNTRVLGAPAGWKQEELPCSALAITDVQVDGMPHVVSFWKPDAADLAALNAGGSIALWIVGQTMPPASVAVEPAP
ncbi:hypothetical protein [Variovorax boronicumulans]|uniref:hypothetical protein n=1 Tax=Variovorax boronicumulans TaxID=436515 RepID=UPI001C5629C6